MLKSCKSLLEVRKQSQGLGFVGALVALAVSAPFEAGSLAWSSMEVPGQVEPVATRSTLRGLCGGAVGSTGGGLLGFCWIPCREKQWPHWAAAHWAPVLQFLVGSNGPGDAGAGSRDNSPAPNTPAVVWDLRNELAKQRGDGLEDSSQRLLCLKSTRGGSTFCYPNLSW